MKHPIITAMMPFAALLSAEEDERLKREISSFLSRAIRNAPWFVQAAALILTPLLWVFLLPSIIIAKGEASAFHVKCRKTVLFLSIWGGPFASLIQLYQYLCALYYYEHPIILQRYGLEPPALRQERYRKIREKMILENP
ncbi:MAG: hypothetical protein EOM37_04630 [Proteobacteria bacterium]|jgi:hypothetical protein|nr:hypothetical protein [Alphaproteobacteria bacterium]NCC03317.1 hypothetical protein [Pseudomonadota bacterium]